MLRLRLALVYGLGLLKAFGVRINLLTVSKINFAQLLSFGPCLACLKIGPWLLGLLTNVVWAQH